MTTKESKKEYLERQKKYMRNRRKDPEYQKYLKSYMKKYRENPEVKERFKKYNKEYQQSSKYLEYKKKYNKSNKKKVADKRWHEKYTLTINSRCSIYRSGAKRRGFTFNFTVKEFESLVSRPCYYCGGNSYGIDRLDSNVGYLKENCVSCCKMCNRMKNIFSTTNFVDQCKKIVMNFEKYNE